MTSASGTGKSGGWWGRQLAMAKVQAVLGRDDGYRNVSRAPCHPCLTMTQMAVVKLLASGVSHQAVAEELGCSIRAVKFHIQNAAWRIPGEGQQTARLIYWYRGVPGAVLAGVPPDPPHESVE